MIEKVDVALGSPVGLVTPGWDDRGAARSCENEAAMYGKQGEAGGVRGGAGFCTNTGPGKGSDREGEG